MKGLVLPALTILASSAFGIVPNNPIATFPGIGRMVDVSGTTVTTMGTAFAISPNYILTASHVGGQKFEQNGVVYPVLQTIAHPTADLAIKRVGTPLFTALPIKTNFLPGGVPTVQTFLSGEITSLQGYGWTSTYSSTGFPYAGNNEGSLRQARNRIDLFMPQVQIDLGGGNFKTTDYLMYDLDDPLGQSPVNTLGGAAVGPDEGGMYTFDSGCPWTVLDGGRQRAVAIGGIVGTFTGSGVTRPLNWGGFGGGANIQSYASWIFANVPDYGRCILQAPLFTVGSLMAGTTSNLYDSDNVALSTQTNMSAADTEFGLEMYMRGNTTASPAVTLAVFLEGRSNSSLSVVQVALKNVATGSYVEVGSFLMFGTDTSSTINVPSPNSYIAPNGDVDMRLTATAIGDEAMFYDTHWDVIRITASPN